MDALDRALEARDTARTLNDAAYVLPLVGATASRTLLSAWDSVGWVRFRKGELEEAEAARSRWSPSRSSARLGKRVGAPPGSTRA